VGEDLTIEQLRTALVEFATRYNETWLVARHGYKTPAKIRAIQMNARPLVDPKARAVLPLAA
jgi:putative transposase